MAVGLEQIIKLITCIVKTVMFLTFLFSFHEYLPGATGGCISGLEFAFLPVWFAVFMTQCFGVRLHDVLNIARDPRNGRVLFL